MAQIKYDDWRSENAKRNYPFADSATLTNGTITLPKSLLLDARLYPIGGGPRQYISAITKAATLITFTISDDTQDLATASFDEAAIPDNGEVALYDTYGRPAGVFVSTETALRSFGSIDAGEYTFLVTETAFAATVVIPQPALGVRGVQLPSGDVLTGDVWIVGEDGIVVRDDGDGALRVDAIGDPFAEQKLCTEEETAEVQLRQPYCPVKTINGVEPDEQGNIMLVTGSNQSLTNVLRIIPQADSGDDLLAHVGQPNQLATAVLVVQALGDRRMRGV